MGVLSVGMSLWRWNGKELVEEMFLFDVRLEELPPGWRVCSWLVTPKS